MKNLEGIYENGIIKLLGRPLAKKKARVVITFIEEKSAPSFDYGRFKAALRAASDIFSRKDELNLRKTRREWDKRIKRVYGG